MVRHFAANSARDLVAKWVYPLCRCRLFGTRRRVTDLAFDFVRRRSNRDTPGSFRCVRHHWHLNLLTAGVLLFSKRFSAQFSTERMRQPGYKRYLKWSVAVAVIGGVAIATVNDIIRLASN